MHPHSHDMMMGYHPHLHNDGLMAMGGNSNNNNPLIHDNHMQRIPVMHTYIIHVYIFYICL